jgi:plasmid stabilization system protein ParE
MQRVFSPLAEHDIEEIADYIALDDPRRAVSFIREIRERLDFVELGDRYGAGQRPRFMGLAALRRHARGCARERAADTLRGCGGMQFPSSLPVLATRTGQRQGFRGGPIKGACTGPASPMKTTIW